MLINFDIAFIIRDAEGTVIDKVAAGCLRCSKTSDNVLISYRNSAGEFRSRIIWSISDESLRPPLEVALDQDQFKRINLQYGECLVPLSAGTYALNLAKISQLALDKATFYRVVGVAYIAQQLAYRELLGVEKSAVEFAEDTVCSIYKIPAHKSSAPQNKDVSDHREFPAVCKYSIIPEAPTKALLNSIRTGDMSKFALPRLQKVLSKGEPCEKTLLSILPQKGELFDVFREVFAENFHSSPLGYDAHEFLENKIFYRTALAIQDTLMFEIKTMLMEYNYFPVILQHGVKTCGVNISIIL